MKKRLLKALIKSGRRDVQTLALIVKIRRVDDLLARGYEWQVKQLLAM